jgi:hypothetical protein
VNRKALRAISTALGHAADSQADEGGRADCTRRRPEMA